ncbi:uncharacterized protein LOC132563102 [Ylistrum balloti]|uniref:uncharacterized protein LOC132563102 n=1 Tax=Ylistrum balloti TaxID=509963 RepID=UPI0029059B1D|nr:uncharacterized protein LOC132563102 [Ylistrum balloti]
MIFIAAFLIGVVTSIPLSERYCDDTTSLALVYGLNEKSVENRPFSEFMRLLEIDLNDILSKEDLLILLGDRCRSKSLTLDWLLTQAETACPHPHKIRSIIEPSGVICHQNGDLTELTKNALGSFVRVNKSIECSSAYNNIMTDCETDALFDVAVPLYPERTLETDMETKNIQSKAAIRCMLPRVQSLAPGCGTVADLKTYSLVSELLQKQPFKLRGEVEFEDFADLMA